MADAELKLDYDRLGHMLTRLLAARGRSSVVPGHDHSMLRAEYLVAVDIIKLLTDIRFRVSCS
jgi:hypothetical protein